MRIIDPDANEKAQRIQLIIFDVDGVLTDGSIIIHADRSESKSFNVKDGHGIKLAMRAGIQAAIITGRKSDVVRYRAEELGIEHLFQGKLEKSGTVTKLLDRLKLSPEEAAFVGDDLIDIPAMRMVGLAAAVADAARGSACSLIVGRFDPLVRHREARLLRTLAERGRFAVSGASETVRQRLIERGVPEDVCAVIRPGVDFGRVNAAKKDATLRGELGLARGERMVLAGHPVSRRLPIDRVVWSGHLQRFLELR